MTKILSNADGNLRLELRDDRLSAWLTVMDQGRLTDENEILELIEQAGIKTGFDEAQKYIRKHGLEREYNTPFPVAMCDRVKGETQLNYYFDLDLAKQFEASIRLEDMDQLTCIEAGTVLADFSSNIFQRQGSIYDIYGEMMQDEEFDPTQAQRLLGDNVSLDNDRHQVLAEKSGFVQVGEDGKISIIDLITFEGDIEGRGGTLRTPVNLEINGNVNDAEIAAAGDLTVRGSIINSRIHCEGDLAAQAEIKNCHDPGIEVWGDLACGGITASRVLCRGRISFEGSIEDSEVLADGGIESATGAILNGHTESCGDIILAKLGNTAGQKTELEITISPFYKALLMQLTKELIHLKQDALGNSERIQELNQRIVFCEGELDKGLNEFLQRPPEDKIRLTVRGEVLPPVQIRILKHEYNLTTTLPHLELIEKD